MPLTIEHSDEHYMLLALVLAKRGLGSVAPNPSVGCIIIKDGIIVGRGWTQPGGRPHAETMALAVAGKAAAGAAAYVTLEPCAHYGVTPPCATALIEAGIKRVVVGVLDTDPRVAGKGVELLQNAGVETRIKVLENECRAVNEGFFRKVDDDRPMFTAKFATSLDGKIALANGESKWITSAEARRFGHRLRAMHDAILVGVNTVLLDDPSLDCRIRGLESLSPKPIILDAVLRTPANAKLITRARENGLLIITSSNDTEKGCP